MKAKRYYLDRETYYRTCTRHVSPETHAISTEAAAAQLQARGIFLGGYDLENLVRKGGTDGLEIPKSDLPSRHPRWTPELIEAVCKHYNAKPSYFTPLAGFLRDFGLTMDAFYEALEAAYKAAVFGTEEAQGYGTPAYEYLGPIPAEALRFFEFHIRPPMTDKQAGEIRFTLRDEVREELEAKRKAEAPTTGKRKR